MSDWIDEALERIEAAGRTRRLVPVAPCSAAEVEIAARFAMNPVGKRSADSVPLSAASSASSAACASV